MRFSCMAPPGRNSCQQCVSISHACSSQGCRLPQRPPNPSGLVQSKQRQQSKIISARTLLFMLFQLRILLLDRPSQSTNSSLQLRNGPQRVPCLQDQFLAQRSGTHVVMSSCDVRASSFSHPCPFLSKGAPALLLVMAHGDFKRRASAKGRSLRSQGPSIKGRSVHATRHCSCFVSLLFFGFSFARPGNRSVSGAEKHRCLRP